MSVPLDPEKLAEPGMLSAERMIGFRQQRGGLRGVTPPDAVIICLYTGVMRRLRWRHPFGRVRGFLGDLYVTRRAPRRVAIIGNVGIGAPAIANLAEELIAWGAKDVVLLSLSGGLAADLRAADVVVVDRALRDEGTSYHYLAPAREVAASDTLATTISRELASRGISSARGLTWSTDAPYRETRREAATFRAEGALAVDMESAGLFAVAQARSARAASALVIGDTLGATEWSAPPDMRALHVRVRAVLNALVSALAEAA